MHVNIFDHTAPNQGGWDNDVALRRAESLLEMGIPKENIEEPQRAWGVPKTFPVLILLHAEEKDRQACEAELGALKDMRYALIHYSDGGPGGYGTNARNTYHRSISFEQLLKQPLEKWRDFFSTIEEGKPDFGKLFDERLPENAIAAYLLWKAGCDVPANIAEAAKNECGGQSYADFINERFAN